MDIKSSSSGEHPPVSVIGLGAMGSALAGALLAGSHPTTVWNRSPGRADGLVAKGATRVATPADAAAASRLVLICVLDQRAVREILDSMADSVAGRVLVNLTSCTPDQARAAADWAAEHGADYLDGGILADPQDIGAPGTFLLYSGSRRSYETNEATLETLGGAGSYLGADAGLASLYFMALVGLGYETWIGYLQTLALVAAENVEATTFAPFATGMFGASTELLTAMARAVDTGRYPPDAGPLRVHAALMDDVIATRESRGLDAERLRHVKALVDRRVAAGHGDDGFSSLIGAIERG